MYCTALHCTVQVVPGMAGQDPHLDYPYYRHLWPEVAGCLTLPPSHMLCLQVSQHMLPQIQPDLV